MILQQVQHHALVRLVMLHLAFYWPDILVCLVLGNTRGDFLGNDVANLVADRRRYPYPERNAVVTAYVAANKQPLAA